MSSSSISQASPSKDLTSPSKFVKPSDLFKMRRRTSSNHSWTSVANKTPTPVTQQQRDMALATSIISSPLKRMTQNSPVPSKFSPAPHIEPQSPLKCLNNLADPSPVKKLPTLLKNPFNQPVKRRLGFSPRKCESSMRSPNKRTKMLDIDEDANLEVPKMKQTSIRNLTGQCYQNDWTLRTKLRVNFESKCKNWDDSSSTTHRRKIGSSNDESPSKLNDNTISTEAIRNISTVYQHPYLSWLPLYPRLELEFVKKRDNPFTMTEHSQIIKMMHNDWCASLTDLTNLLIDGKCPYFYLCTNNYNILFKHTPSSNPRKPLVQAYISPFSYGMGCELNKVEVEFKCPEITRNGSSTTIANVAKENSQASFCSSQTRTTINLDDESSQSTQQTSNAKVTASIDSGNVSDFDDDFGEDENGDASQFLESIWGSEFDVRSLQTKRKGFVEADSNTQTKSTSNKPLAAIEGTCNILGLVKFLKSNRRYTTSNVGKFACIPPTLLSPREFRLSTRQYPDVIMNKNMIETTSSNKTQRKTISTISPKKTAPKVNGSNETDGPSFIELNGTILPNLKEELHKLLIASDNNDHICLSTTLESSTPFRTIQF